MGRKEKAGKSSKAESDCRQKAVAVGSFRGRRYSDTLKNGSAVMNDEEDSQSVEVCFIKNPLIQPRTVIYR